MPDNDSERDVDEAVSPATVDVTREVGGEGGSPGDVDVESDRAPAAGSEAGETWHPTDDTRRTIVRDETGTGKRSP